jgi:hypothetical protein
VPAQVTQLQMHCTVRLKTFKASGGMAESLDSDRKWRSYSLSMPGSLVRVNLCYINTHHRFNNFMNYI